MCDYQIDGSLFRLYGVFAEIKAENAQILNGMSNCRIYAGCLSLSCAIISRILLVFFIKNFKCSPLTDLLNPLRITKHRTNPSKMRSCNVRYIHKLP